MLLVIDTGNTHTVVGLYEPTTLANRRCESGLIDHWRLSTVPDRTEDELALLVRQLLDLRQVDLANDVTGVAVCSGVPRVTGVLRDMCRRHVGIEPVVVGPGVKSGMSILVENPPEVGADRIANAVAAYEQFGGPCVVVDFGTATTFDVISASGEYVGGSIMPGIEISLEALFARAALLRRVELVAPPTVIGRNTVQSVQSGVVFGFAAQLDGMVDRIVDEIGDVTVVATGGLAELIVPHAATVDHHEPWLTLHGLRLIYEKNSS